MGNFWSKLFGHEDKEVEVAKNGDNYYYLFKQQGEVILTIVQPPVSYGGKTGVGGEISVYDASGKVQVDRSKEIKYGEPIVLFNPHNKAGLQLQGAISETKQILPEAIRSIPEELKGTPDFKDLSVDVDNIDETHTVTVPKEGRVAIGSSGVLQMNEDTSVSLINTPKVDSADREILESLLMFMVRALVRREQTYRANIMLLDPRDNLLKIAAYYNMEGYVDKNITLESNMGCSGTALRRGKEQLYDKSIMGSMGIDPDKIWKELESIISVPIHGSNETRLGVLNIDSNKPIESSHFRDEDFKHAMNLGSDAVGKILERRI
jgi:hypothetical protein